VRRGARIGVDVGSVRVGVAVSDPDGILATPVATLPRDAEGGADLAALAALVAEHDAVEVVVGHPRHLSGAAGAAAREAEAYAAALADRVRVPVRLVDERLTTVSATRMLSDRGVRGKAQREVVDQAAAVAILQSALDALGPA
jgi:putative Holliday junction resolvase